MRDDTTKNTRSTLGTQVYQELEKRILSGAFAPGALLKEISLSQELGVSRTPVREALRRLEAEGLVREAPHGMEVLGITERDLDDIYEIRQRIEGLAARRAAEHITEAQLQELREIIELQEFYTARGNADQIKNMDSAFHEAIYSFCGSPMLQDTLSTFHRRIQKYRKSSLLKKEFAAQAAIEHKRIFEALSQHNPAEAEAQAVAHVRSARNRTREV